MSAAFELLAARAQLYSRSWPHNQYLGYVHENGLRARSLDELDPIARGCGCLAVTRIRPTDGGGFEFATPEDGRAIVAAVIEALGADRETTTDIVAWRTEDPTRFRCMFDRADCLGAWNLTAAAAYSFGPVKIHRTPLGWIRAGCRGAVVLDPDLAARRFLNAIGPIAGDYRAHGEELATMMLKLAQTVAIVAPVDHSFLREAG